MTASIPPSPPAASSIASRHDDSSVTSQAMAKVPGPDSLAASSRSSRRRAKSATCSPRWPSPIPMQRPSPLDAPRTTTRNVCSFLLFLVPTASGLGPHLILARRHDRRRVLPVGDPVLFQTDGVLVLVDLRPVRVVQLVEREARVERVVE